VYFGETHGHTAMQVVPSLVNQMEKKMEKKNSESDTSIG
jgi:hypothetical protein